MRSSAEGASRYSLSFTSGALLTREAMVAAPLYLRERDWTTVRRMIMDDNLLQSRTVSSGDRLVREIVGRLRVLNDDELELLADSTGSERAHMMWLAACRHYELIGEFAEEVLRERYLLLAAGIEHDDFESFIRSKALWHPEIADLKQSTLRKLRSNLFRMLIEAGFITQSGRLLKALPSARVADVLSRATPSDHRYFPTGAGAR